MKNRDLFVRDPKKTKLLNEGVASVSEPHTEQELRTLRFELENFVCDGEYRRGLERILTSYLDHLGEAEQPAAWVSGFYGSGKSHLVKMLRYLWDDFQFPDGARARGLANLPRDVCDLLTELTTAGRRHGGLWAGAGKLGAGAEASIRLEILSLVFRAAGLPEKYPQARFVIWLKREGYYDAVKQFIEDKGEKFLEELQHLYVSPVIANALLAAEPGFADDAAGARSLLKTQFPQVSDVSDADMVQGIRDAISVDDDLPCSLVVLDEVQQYIGEDSQRARLVQHATEACSKTLGARLLFVGTGQSALTGTPQLQKLQGRFRIPIELSDTDVEAVTREVVLAKKPDKVPALKQVLEECSGEISRQLAGTRLGPQNQDDEFIAADYPLLPVRRRFWERALRAVDRAGTAGQLRTQLRIIDEATKATADAPVGTVVPTDFVYDQTATDMIQTGVLLREIHELITQQKDATPEGQLRGRLCALAFLIGQLPREGGADTGVRATADTFADLLVEHLREGSTDLRRRIPERLTELVDAGHLMQVGEEYRIQTRESRSWNQEYQRREGSIRNDAGRIASARADLLRLACSEELKGVRLEQGESKTPRKVDVSYGPEPPDSDGQSVPVWVRDEWAVTLNSVLADAREAGTEDPVVHVFLPRRSAEDLKRAIARREAAKETLDYKGVPSTDEGKEARHAMETRQEEAERTCQTIVNGVLEAGRVFLGGGSEATEGLMLHVRVQNAAKAALSRLYPRFEEADDHRWDGVVRRAREGDADALEAVGYTGDVESHLVCSEILGELSNWKTGRDVRKKFEAPPYGWPRDAINGALLVLVATGHLQARHQGNPQKLKDLDATRTGVAEFRAETVVITAAQRIALRKLYQAADVGCKPGDEANVVPLFLQEMQSRARQAGDPPPWPEEPSTSHLREIQGLAGNEQLVKLYEMRERLTQEAQQWQSIGRKIAERKPRWDALQTLLRHAQGLPAAEEAEPQVNAIQEGRGALGTPDPVPPLCDKLTGALREALTQAHETYCQTYDAEMETLEADENWQELSAGQQQALLADNALHGKPGLKVGSEEEVIESLESISLDSWQTLTDALPARFQKVKLQAAKLLAPKARRISLPGATLRTEQEVDEWLKRVREMILKNLQDGDTDAIVI